MPLNRPLPESVDVLIIGSGFGGSLVAAELATYGRADEETQNICLVERGKAYPPGTFPRDAAGITANFWAPEAGLFGMFDIWHFDHIDAVISSGLGGGSLIYANVMLPMDENWFTQKTPKNLDVNEKWTLERTHLDEHYEAIVEFLRVEELPNGPTVPEEFHLEKTNRFLHGRTPALEATTATADDRGYAPLAVRFYDEQGQPRVSAPLPHEDYGSVHGMPTRTTCALIGECDLGCNEGAKSSLDHTYLSYASHHGVSIHTSTEVTTLTRHEDERSHPFEITVRAHPSGTEHTINARRVVLAAGTIGTSYLLLKNQAALGIRPLIDDGKPVLGSRFSGNGDFLTFVRDAPDGLDATKGPVITAYRRYDASTDAPEPETSPDPGGDGYVAGRHGMYIEDAGYPDFRRWLGRPPMATGLSGAWATRWRADRPDTDDPELATSVDEVVVESLLPPKNFMPLLGMGRDRPDGSFSLDADSDRLTCSWTVDTSRSYFETMKRRMKIIAEEMGGRFLSNPLYDLLNRVITVHPVGGCPMDTTEHEGVIDTYGRVRGVDGLRVCDGSVFPGPIGPNPSLTIAAFARRSAHNLLQEKDFTEPPRPADAYREVQPAASPPHFTT